MSEDTKRLDKARRIQNIADAIRNGDPAPYMALSWLKLATGAVILLCIGAAAGHFIGGIAPYYASYNACAIANLPLARTDVGAHRIDRICRQY